MSLFRKGRLKLHLGFHDQYSESKTIQIMEENGWEWVGSY